MKAKITGLKLENVKRIKLVEFQPNTDGLTIIGGNNGEGKTSVLDAIAYALGGEAFRPSNLVNGDGNAYIKVEVGDYTVERGGKNAALKITDRKGMKGGQKLLDDIIGKFALNLSGFMDADDRKKAEMLLKMFPDLANALEDLRRQESEEKERRADVNRDIKRMQFQFDGMPKGEDAPPSEISISNLSKELQDEMCYEASLEGKKQRLKNEEQNLSRLGSDYTRISEKITELENKIKLLTEELGQNWNRLDTLREEGLCSENKISELENELKNARPLRIDEIRKEIDNAEALNRMVRQKEEARRVYDEIQKMKQTSEAMTAALDVIGNKRIELLKNASLPLPELSISGEGDLLYKNQKWDCMSGAERLKVATAICMEANPECGFVLIDGLEAMDDRTLDEFGAYLAEKNMQGIGTIVGKNEHASILIEDGRILTQTQP